MANKVQEIERDGRTIAIYDNGLERDVESGRIVKPAPGALITSENARVIQRKRQEKAAAKLRARILASTQRRSDVKLSGSADAVAEAGGYIWDEVVLGEDVYPRDRLEAWEKLSKYAGVLPADVKRQDVSQADTVDAMTSLVRELAAFAASIAGDNSYYRKHEVIEAQTGDVDNEEGEGEENGGGGEGVS